VAAGAVVVGTAAWRVATVVLVGRGAVVVGAPVVVVTSDVVVVVLSDVVVEDRGTGSSVAATCIDPARGATPAGDAPAQVETPTRAIARRGLATIGFITGARMVGKSHHRERSRESTLAAIGHSARPGFFPVPPD
jgi:hypothetical protein